MDYFIQSELESLAGSEAMRDSLSAVYQLRQISETVRNRNPLPSLLLERAGGQLPPPVFDIFLSYSSQDITAVLGLYKWLGNRGYRVYLDCFDSSLPNPAVVKRATAEVLRKRMVQSRSLFVVTTQNTPSSDWVPWELGFTDGLTNKAAVLYIAPRPGISFGRLSYFELYPEVKNDNARRKPDDLVLSDPLKSPHFACSWGHWLAMPKQY